MPKSHLSNTRTIKSYIEGIPLDHEQAFLNDLKRQLRDDYYRDSEGWKCVYDKGEDGCRVWSKPEARGICTKYTTHLPVSVEEAVAFIRKPANLLKWDLLAVRNRHASEVSEGGDELTRYTHLETVSYWPLSSRECFLVSTGVEDDDGTTHIIGRSLDGIPLRNPKNVRVVVLFNCFTLSPLRDYDQVPIPNRCKLTRIQHFDMNAAFVPSSLTRHVLLSAIPESVERIVSVLQKEINIPK